MYKKTNPTALQSQRWLSDSLIKLMREKPYQQITIMNICKQADLSRQTFYNLFNTKEEVLRFCLQNEYEKQFLRFCEQEKITVNEIVEAFMSVVEENREILELMVDNHLENIISDEIAKCISMFTIHFINPKKKREILPYSEVMLSGALSHLLVYWFRQEEAISTEQLTLLIKEFLEGKLYKL